MKRISLLLVVIMILTAPSTFAMPPLGDGNHKELYDLSPFYDELSKFEMSSAENIDSGTIIKLSSPKGEEIVIQEEKLSDFRTRFIVTEEGVQNELIYNIIEGEIFLNGQLLATIECTEENVPSALETSVRALNRMGSGSEVAVNNLTSEVSPMAQGVFYTTETPMLGWVSDYVNGTYSSYTVKFTNAMTTLSVGIFTTIISACVFPLTWGGAITSGAVGLAHSSISDWLDWYKLKTPSSNSVKYRAYKLPYKDNTLHTIAYKHYLKFYDENDSPVPMGVTNSRYQTMFI